MYIVRGRKFFNIVSFQRQRWWWGRLANASGAQVSTWTLSGGWNVQTTKVVVSINILQPLRPGSSHSWNLIQNCSHWIHFSRFEALIVCAGFLMLWTVDGLSRWKLWARLNLAVNQELYKILRNTRTQLTITSNPSSQKASLQEIYWPWVVFHKSNDLHLTYIRSRLDWVDCVVPAK